MEGLGLLRRRQDLGGPLGRFDRAGREVLESLLGQELYRRVRVPVVDRRAASRPLRARRRLRRSRRHWPPSIGYSRPGWRGLKPAPGPGLGPPGLPWSGRYHAAAAGAEPGRRATPPIGHDEWPPPPPGRAATEVDDKIGLFRTRKRSPQIAEKPSCSCRSPHVKERNHMVRFGPSGPAARSPVPGDHTNPMRITRTLAALGAAVTELLGNSTWVLTVALHKQTSSIVCTCFSQYRQQCNSVTGNIVQAATLLITF